MWAWIETGVTIIEHCIYAEFITRFLTPKKQGNELLCFLVIAVFSGGITLVFNQFLMVPFIVLILRRLSPGPVYLAAQLAELAFVLLAAGIGSVVMKKMKLGILLGQR
jgi:hypothetical protein